MRLTESLLMRYPKYYYWGWGKGEWGRVKHRQRQHKCWKYSILLQSKKPLPTISAKLPENVAVEDPNKFIKNDYLMQNFDYEKLHPWPYNKVGEEGTPSDPKYKQEQALIFDRKTIIYEGFKGAANFCNAIIESDNEPPQIVHKLEKEVAITSKLMDVINRRIDWCQNDDGFLYRLPNVKKFPRLNYNWPIQFGVPSPRREFTTLLTFYDTTDLFASRDFGFVDRRRLWNPKTTITFERDGKLVVCNLGCDFVTTSSMNASSNEVKITENTLFSDDINSTIEKPLINIQPCNWEICFDKSHFYDERIQYAISPSARVHTIYLGTNYNHLKPLVDRFMKGRAVMMCYGYAVAEARRLFGEAENFRDIINYKDIPEPITTQCVFINESKKSIGFVFFQLNTLSFNSNIKNQLWFSGPYNYNENREEIMRTLIAIHRLGRPGIAEKQRVFSVN